MWISCSHSWAICSGSGKLALLLWRQVNTPSSPVRAALIGHELCKRVLATEYSMDELSKESLKAAQKEFNTAVITMLNVIDEGWRMSRKLRAQRDTTMIPRDLHVKELLFPEEVTIEETHGTIGGHASAAISSRDLTSPDEASDEVARESTRAIRSRIRTDRNRRVLITGAQDGTDVEAHDALGYIAPEFKSYTYRRYRRMLYLAERRYRRYRGMLYRLVRYIQDDKTPAKPLHWLPSCPRLSRRSDWHVKKVSLLELALKFDNQKVASHPTCTNLVNELWRGGRQHNGQHDYIDFGGNTTLSRIVYLGKVGCRRCLEVPAMKRFNHSLCNLAFVFFIMWCAALQTKPTMCTSYPTQPKPTKPQRQVLVHAAVRPAAYNVLVACLVGFLSRAAGGKAVQESP